MSREDFHGQAAAQRAYDNQSPHEPDDSDYSDALDNIATRMAADFDVGELLEDLHDGGSTYGALDRLMCGQRPQFGDASTLQKLRDRLLWLEREVDKECES